MSQAKNWAFTYNNPSATKIEELQELQHDESVTYIVFQAEKGTSGTLHLQGYLQVASRIRLPRVKRYLGTRVHAEVARGSAEQNRLYCTKEPREDGPWEYGTITTAGKRTDIEAFVQDMKESPLTESEIIDKHPMILAKYPRFVNTVRRALAEKKLPERPFCPRVGWQSALAACLLDDPDPRKVRWYFDQVGGSGKSTFGLGVRLRDGGRPFICTGGKHSDIYYAYGRQSAVIFDWPRSNEESFPYAVAEAFKNGYFLNTKYESVPVFFNPVHVIVFANFYPDKTKLSMDRWDIHIIDNSLLQIPTLTLPPPAIP